MLTNVLNSAYTESLKNVIPAFAPVRFCDFFVYPFGWMRAENIQYQPKHCITAFSESTLPHTAREILKKVIQMTNSITIFNFKNNSVRTQIFNGEPYFCLRDVCEALSIQNSKDRTFNKGVETFYLPTPSGKQNIKFINEPNLYRLIFRSNKPQAQAFADWVYTDVLPSIRKTGSYGISQEELNNWKDIVSKILTVRTQYLVQEEKNKILTQISNLLGVKN